MRHKRLSRRPGFHVGITKRSAQAASFVLMPGGKAGGPDNRHRGSDQWIYVVTGTGQAKVNGRQVGLKPGTLLLIERGDTHELRNTGRGQLQTVNFYEPPAYQANGEPMARGRP